MTEFVLILVAGIVNGATFVMIALGFVIIFRATKVLSLAQGQFLALAAYLLFSVSQDLHLNVFLSIVIGEGAMCVVGFLAYRVAIQRLAGTDVIRASLATLGISYIGTSAILLAWGSSSYSLTVLPGANSRFKVGIVRFTGLDIELVVAAAAIYTAALLWSRYSRQGLALRAASESPVLASQVGMNPFRIFAVAWIVGAAAAGLGGIALGEIGSVSPSIETFGLLALAPALLGGFDSIAGVAIGGVGVGLLQALVSVLVGGQAATAAVFGVILVVILLRPQGILGSKDIARV